MHESLTSHQNQYMKWVTCLDCHSRWEYVAPSNVTRSTPKSAPPAKATPQSRTAPPSPEVPPSTASSSAQQEMTPAESLRWMIEVSKQRAWHLADTPAAVLGQALTELEASPPAEEKRLHRWKMTQLLQAALALQVQSEERLPSVAEMPIEPQENLPPGRPVQITSPRIPEEDLNYEILPEPPMAQQQSTPAPPPQQQAAPKRMSGRASSSR